MPQLIIEQPSVPPMTVPIAGGEMHFGRAEDNDVVLVADEVSRHHAVVCRRGSKTVLVDKNSLNGTYVNRQRVVERVLTHLDEIWFGGKCRIVYRDDTCFGRDHAKEDKSESKLMRDVDKIRAEMDRVGNSLTMIARSTRTPFPGTLPTPVPQTNPEDVLTMSRAYRRLSALYRASELISSEFDLPKRLANVLDKVIEVMEADRGFVLLKDEYSNKLIVSVAREMGQDLAASSPSMGIAGQAAIDGEPVLMGNASTDQEFGLRDSVIRQQITSAMAVPLRIEDRTLGAIYIDTRRRDIEFNNDDLELFVALAAQSAMAIDNVRLNKKMVDTEKKRANLSRFLSPTIVDEIMKTDVALELGGQKHVVTTLFCDIRGFTQIAERVPPKLMVDILNEHFSAMTQIIFHEKGTLDKYIGDEIMAVFGAPINDEDDALRAVRAALAIQAKNTELNEQRAHEGRPVLHLGIGINTGEVIAGYIGSVMRMEFTVVGDHVNIARRLCDIAKPGQVVIGGATHQLVSDKVDSCPLGNVMLAGKAIPVDVFEIVGLKAAAK
jgi:adenylate cyclase